MFGSLGYLALNFFFSPSVTILLMLVGPLAMFLAHINVLRPLSVIEIAHSFNDSECSQQNNIDSKVNSINTTSVISLRKKMQGLPKIRIYLLSLLLVYFCEYLINMGVYESVYWNDIFIDKATQYRGFQTIYQFGVFVSRSSRSFFPIYRIWIPAALQALNLVLFTLDCWWKLAPNIWICFFAFFFEGLWGGLAYVNSYHLIRAATNTGNREFYINLACLACSIGTIKYH